MKKLNLLLIAITLSFFILSSCKTDDDLTQAPTITVTPSDDTVKVHIGDVVDYQVNWSSADPLQTAKISYKAGSLSQIILDTTFTTEVKSFGFNLQIEITDAIPVGTTIEFTYFGSTKDNSTLFNKYVFVEAGMSEYLGVILQAQADGPVTAGTNLSFYASTTNERFTLNQSANADTAALIDLVFTHHSVFKTNDELSFQSPNSANLHQMWAEFLGFDPPYDYTTDDKNQTYFKKVDVTDWDNLDYDAIEDIVGDIGTEVKVRGINIGDYIAFETHKGKKGIIKVTDTVIEHNPYNDALISFDVKVQK